MENITINTAVGNIINKFYTIIVLNRRASGDTSVKMG